MMKAMCGVQLTGRKRIKDLMLVLNLIKTVDQWLDQILCLGMVICRGRRALELEGEWKKGTLSRT